MAKLRKLVYSIASFALVLGSLMTFSAPTALAAPAYDYQLISQSAYPATLAPGATTNVYIEVKNTGTATWGSNVRLGSGSAYGAANQQRDYNSEFANSDWLSANRPCGMSNGGPVTNIIPGWVVRFQFNIKAPTTPGTYKAYFTPVADGVTWMKDIGIYWQITVSDGTTPPDGGGTPSPVTGALNVALASDTPVANSIIADTTAADGAQAMVPMAKFNFTAPTSGEAKVTTLKVKRIGIASDSDIAAAYLYDGDTRIAEYTSISSGIISFINSNGLFTVGAGGTKGITVKVDLINGLTASKTIGLAINAASDVVSNVSSVAGTFPVNGNIMNTATVADLGKLTVANVSAPASVDPGTTGTEIWRFTLAGSDQKLNVKYLKLTNVGTIATGDLANLKLTIGGVQIGSTAAGLASDGTVVFDLSASPLVIDTGVTKTVVVSADIIGGTGRSFYLSIQKSSDIVALDTNYGVYIKPNQTDSFTVIKPAASTNIATGSATLTVNSSSPSGNVAMGSTGVTLAKFDIKAAGEAVKISTIIVQTVMTVSGDDAGLKNGKIFVDGSQIGTTTNLDSDNTSDTDFTDTGATASPDDDSTFNLGNSLIIPAGTTKTVSVVADILDATGAALTANSVITVSIGGILAQGQTSLNTVTFGTATGRNLTAVTGTLTTSTNLGMANAAAANPTGVVGKAGAKIGSFVLTASTGEGASVSQITLKDGVANACGGGDGGYLGCDFQNVKLMNGSTQIGSTVGSLSSTAANSLSFTPSSAISIAAGQQYVVDVYADILSNAQDTAAAFVGIILDSVTATGLVTSGTADDTNDRNGQNVYITTSGALVISVDASTPSSAQLVMGATDQPIAAYKFAASTAEDLNVSKVVIRDTVTGETAGLINYKLFDGTTQIGSTISGVDGSGDVTFQLATPWVIPAGANKVLTVKASVNTSPDAISADNHIITIQAASSLTVDGAGSGVSITPTVTDADNVFPVVGANAMKTYYTLLTISKASIPTTTLTPGVMEVLRLNLTANPRADVYMTNASGAQLQFTINQAGGIAGNRDVVIYDASDDSILDTITVADLTTAGTVLCDFSSKDLVIAAGQTKTIYVKVNLVDYATAGESFSLSIAKDANQKWYDGVSLVADSLTKNLPITGDSVVKP